MFNHLLTFNNFKNASTRVKNSWVKTILTGCSIAILSLGNAVIAAPATATPASNASNKTPNNKTTSSKAVTVPAKTSARNDSQDDKVEFKSSLPVTQEEIAAVNVLGEICPKLLGNDPKFNAGYEHLLAELLPNIKQPVLSLKALQDDAEYQKILAQARADANKATVKDNREVCQEIAQYNSSSNHTAPAPVKKTKK